MLGWKWRSERKNVFFLSQFRWTGLFMKEGESFVYYKIQLAKMSDALFVNFLFKVHWNVQLIYVLCFTDVQINPVLSTLFRFNILTQNIVTVPVESCWFFFALLYIIACSETFLCTQVWIYSQILLCPLHFRKNTIKDLLMIKIKSLCLILMNQKVPSPYFRPKIAKSKLWRS